MKKNALLKSMITLAFGLFLGMAVAQAAPATGAKTNAPASKIMQAATVGDIPESVFTVPATPKEGRNPFFPNSVPLAASSVAKAAVPTIDSSAFVLNGITSPPKRTAMINGRTFEPGEEAEIKLPSGSRVLVKCAEIKDDAAIIVVGGVRRELRLRFAL